MIEDLQYIHAGNSIENLAVETPNDLNVSLTAEEDLRRMIRDAGFIPKQRDTLYQTLYINS